MECNNDNGKVRIKPPFHANALGSLFRNAGYRTAYTGRRHLAGQRYGRENMADFGFHEDLATEDLDGRQPAVDAAVQFIKGKHTKPFLLVVSICLRPAL